MLRQLFKRGNFVALLVGLLLLGFLIDTGIKAFAQEQKRNEIKEEVNFHRPEPMHPIQPEVPTANRYQEDKVFLEYADSLYKVTNRWDTVERQILKGNVKFRQSGLWMFCDSAYYYPEENSLDAFSNVRMEQGDTLFVYADKMFYNGNEHLAKLKNGLTREKVTLINKDVTLTTDSLDYDMLLDKGWYLRWGTLDDKVNTLTSLYGEYSPKTKIAEFFTDVVLKNTKDGYTMYTDTLYYSTDTHIANIESRTEIQSENDTIITNLATYYTDSGNADLLSRSMIIHRDSTGNVVTLEGDSIIYDNTTRISRAYMFKDPFKRSAPMVITDTAQKTTLIGGFGIYNDSTKEALATNYPLLMEYSQKDTLFLRADTIVTFIVTEMLPSKKRKTKSGFPEFEGKPIVMKDSLGKLWIDTTYFKVEIPLANMPLRMLMAVAPPYEKPKVDSIGPSLIEDISEIEPIDKDSIEYAIRENIPDSLSYNINEFIEISQEGEMPLPVSQEEPFLKEVAKLEENDVKSIKGVIEEDETIIIENADSVISSEKIIIETSDIDPEKLITNLAGEAESKQIDVDNLDVSKLFADSLLSGLDQNSPDTIIDEEDYLKPDSIPHEFHVVLAYHRGRFFKQDMQGVADSIVFVEADSMLYLFRKPIIWSEERQVTGNRIDVHFNDSTTDWAYLPEFGLMSEWVEEDFFNQIYGKEITAYFADQGLRRMSISGNVETIFLPQESDSTYNRLVDAESSYMEVYLTANKLDWLKMWPEVSGTVTPIFLVKRAQMYLQKFKWWSFLRPEREWYGDQMHWADNLGEVPDELEQYFLTPSDFGEPKSFEGKRVIVPPSMKSLKEVFPENLEMDSLNNLSSSLDSLNTLGNEMIVPDSISTGLDSKGVEEQEKTETLQDIENTELQEQDEAEETEEQTLEIQEAITSEEEDSENTEEDETANDDSELQKDVEESNDSRELIKMKERTDE